MLKIKYLIAVLMLFKSMELLAENMDPIDKILDTARNNKTFCKQGMGSFVETIRSFSGQYCADKIGGSIAMVVCSGRQFGFQESNCAAKAIKAGIQSIPHLAYKQLKELIKEDPSNLQKACDIVEKILPDNGSCKNINPSSPISPVVLPKVEPAPAQEQNASSGTKIVYDQAAKDKAEADLQAISFSSEKMQTEINAIKEKKYSSTDRPPVTLVKEIYAAIMKKGQEMGALRDLVDKNNYLQAANILSHAETSAYWLLDRLKNMEDSLNDANKLKDEFNLQQSVDEISAIIEKLLIDVDSYWFSENAARAIRNDLTILKTAKQRADYFRLGNKVGFSNAGFFVFLKKDDRTVLNNLYEEGIKYPFAKVY